MLSSGNTNDQISPIQLVLMAVYGAAAAARCINSTGVELPGIMDVVVVMSVMFSSESRLKQLLGGPQPRHYS